MPSRRIPRNPGVYIEEIEIGARPIEDVSTSVVGFFGETEKGPAEPHMIRHWSEYLSLFGGFIGVDRYLPFAIKGFFDNGGQSCYVSRVINSDYQRSLNDLGQIGDIALLYTPNIFGVAGLAESLISQCENLKNRFAILDAPHNFEVSQLDSQLRVRTSYGALYYPWLKVTDPGGQNALVPPGGHVAGIYARTDYSRGVHKAPANEPVMGVTELEIQLGQVEQGLFNSCGVNVIREFPGRGLRLWGARTLSEDPAWRYINVRRLMIYIEQSITSGTRWALFEPNEEKLWARLKSTTTEFLTRVWREGALMGRKQEEAFFVKLDRTTMTQDDIERGRVIMQVGVAPVKPAEFLIFRVIQQNMLVK